MKNFDGANIQVFEKNWNKIKKSITECFKLLESWGFNDSNLKAKNAVIPIIYYVYHNNLEYEIDNKAKHMETKEQIRKWLCLSLLKGVFAGQSDAFLTKIRGILKNNSGQFPLEQIKNEFKSDPVKNLTFDNDFIDGLLTIQKESANCYIVLSLLYSHLNFDTQEFHKDHLHPASYFQKLKKTNLQPKENFDFYSDKNNWNGVANLQLLNSNLNQSKSDTPLAEWIHANNIDLDNQLIPKDISLDIDNFEDFIEKRKELLRKKIKQMTE